MKSFIISLVSLLTLPLLPVPSLHAQVYRDPCQVSESIDNPADPGFGTLRGDLEEGFNRTSDRLCTESITFLRAGDFSIRLAAPLLIDNDYDLDSDGDGWGLVIDGEGATVVIDAEDLPPDECVFVVRANRVLITHLTIRNHNPDRIFCDDGNRNYFVDNVTDRQELLVKPFPRPEDFTVKPKMEPIPVQTPENLREGLASIQVAPPL